MNDKKNKKAQSLYLVSLLKFIIANLITCGFYSFFWWFKQFEFALSVYKKNNKHKSQKPKSFKTYKYTHSKPYIAQKKFKKTHFQDIYLKNKKSFTPFSTKNQLINKYIRFTQSLILTLLHPLFCYWIFNNIARQAQLTKIRHHWDPLTFTLLYQTCIVIFLLFCFEVLSHPLFFLVGIGCFITLIPVQITYNIFNNQHLSLTKSI